MKLLCCVVCQQIISLHREYQECRGTHGGGQYIDDVNAVVWGARNQVVVLAFLSSSLKDAISAQLRDGDSDERMRYHGKQVAVGRAVGAYVVPESAGSVQRFDVLHDFLAARRRPGGC